MRAARKVSGPSVKVTLSKLILPVACAKAALQSGTRTAPMDAREPESPNEKSRKTAGSNPAAAPPSSVAERRMAARRRVDAMNVLLDAAPDPSRLGPVLHVPRV